MYPILQNIFYFLLFIICIPLHTFRITSAAAIPGYGVDPNVTISHIKIPKLQMSDFTENILSYNDSIAIHLEK